MRFNKPVMFAGLGCVAALTSLTAALSLLGSSPLAAQQQQQLCWEVIERVCTDCPEQMSHFCNIKKNGPFKSCAAADPTTCDAGGCPQADPGPTGCGGSGN